MLKQILDLMQEDFKEFCILSEHENGYCYELLNIAVPMEKADVDNHFKSVLKDFNNRHKNIAITYLKKDKLLYQRMVQIQLHSYGITPQKDFYERLFINIHKAQSPITKLIVTPIELFHLTEGIQFS